MSSSSFYVIVIFLLDFLCHIHKIIIVTDKLLMLFRAVLKGDVITEESNSIWNIFKNMTVID